MHRLHSWAMTPILALALVACGGSTEPRKETPGPLKLGIVSGQGQVVTAGSSQLGAPVVGRLVRQANGQVAWQRLERVGGWIIRPAYAQGTVVTGSPVPGAVVCAVSVDHERTLTPFVPCTNTDSNGQATFFFTPGTRAGTAEAEIRGTVDQSPAVFDTARAVVVAGAVDTLRTWSAAVFPGESFPVGMLVLRAADRYGNAVSNPAVTVTLPDGWMLVNGTVTAPTHEAYDWITVAAGSVSIRNSFKVLRDLSAHTWDATWGCGPTAVNGTTLDSVRVNAVVTFAYVPITPEIPLFRSDNPLLSYTGTALWYRAGGVVDTVAAQNTRLTTQRPDTITGAYNNAAINPYIVRVADAPLAYEGGNWECPGPTNYSYLKPFRMVARP